MLQNIHNIHFVLAVRCSSLRREIEGRDNDWPWGAAHLIREVDHKGKASSGSNRTRISGRETQTGVNVVSWGERVGVGGGGIDGVRGPGMAGRRGMTCLVLENGSGKTLNLGVRGLGSSGTRVSAGFKDTEMSRYHKWPSGVPVVAQQKRIRLGSMKTRVRSLASLGGLRIRPCH